MKASTMKWGARCFASQSCSARSACRGSKVSHWLSSASAASIYFSFSCSHRRSLASQCLMNVRFSFAACTASSFFLSIDSDVGQQSRTQHNNFASAAEIIRSDYGASPYSCFESEQQTGRKSHNGFGSASPIACASPDCEKTHNVLSSESHNVLASTIDFRGSTTVCHLTSWCQKEPQRHLHPRLRFLASSLRFVTSSLQLQRHLHPRLRFVPSSLRNARQTLGPSPTQ